VKITGVRVCVVDPDARGLRAYASVQIDGLLVVRDLKVVHIPRGLVVVMPERRFFRHCEDCGEPNHTRANYCNGCGRPLTPRPPLSGGKVVEHMDVMNPTCAEGRRLIEDAVLPAYEQAAAEWRARKGVRA